MSTPKDLTTPAARTAALREWMYAHAIDAFIVPTADPHDSEYLPDRWKTREWLTGFTGSAGLALLTADEGWLWTDSRYFLQAAEQLRPTPYRLMRDGEPDTPTLAEVLGALCGQSAANRTFTVSFVAETMPVTLLGELQQALAGKGPACRLCPAPEDPFDNLWSDRPGLPAAPVVVQAESDAGVTAAEKLDAVRAALQLTDEGGACLLGDLSEIAWLLNIRGGDVDYNPFVLSYLLIAPAGATLFVGAQKLSPAVKDHLRANRVETAPYEAVTRVAEDFCDGGPLYVAEGMNCAVAEAVKSHPDVRYVPSPVPAMRAVKNEAEVAGFRRAMLRDGVAMVRFLRRLDEAMAQGQTLTECDVDTLLTALRAEGDRYCSLSFPTIAAYGPNGAIVHYEAEPETAAVLRPKGLLLLDSGAQYEDGTTDITRTIALGPLTDEECRAYTLVLSAHIALAMGRYPEGAVGLQIDAAARRYLWNHGYDFGHGTGHGVGSRLGVHEGPHQIRKNVRGCTMVPFRAGMVVTNEPGVYVAGRFGVRLENVLLALPPESTPFGSFFGFETLTLCPFDLRPVDSSLLPPEQVRWLNDYHAQVRQRLLPLLSDEADRRWLQQATSPLPA